MRKREEWEREKQRVIKRDKEKRNDGRDRYRWGETKRRLGRETRVGERGKEDREKDKNKGRRKNPQREAQRER